MNHNIIETLMNVVIIMN